MTDFQLATKMAEEFVGSELWIRSTPSQRAHSILEQLAILDAAYVASRGVERLCDSRPTPKRQAQAVVKPPRTVVQQPIATKVAPKTPIANPFHLPEQLARARRLAAL